MNAESNTIVVAQPTNRVSPVRLGREQDAGMALFPPGQLPSTQIPADWNQTNPDAKDYIKNKPAIPSEPADIGAAAAQHTHAQADVTGLDDALAGKAAAQHTHAQADVAGLAGALAGKAAANHGHKLEYNYPSLYTDQQEGTMFKANNKNEIVPAVPGTDYAAASHTHSQSDVSGLADTLAGKAAASHTHSQSDVSGLGDELAGKAAASHTHSQSDVSGLGDALAGKAAATHTHTTSDISDFPAIPTVPTNVSAFQNDAGYLTAHQELRYALAAPTVTPAGAAASATLQDRAVNTVSLGASVESAAFTLPAATAGRARDFFLRLVTAGSALATVTFTDPATSASVDVEIGADELGSWNTAGTRLVLFTEIAVGKWLVSKKEASS